MTPKDEEETKLLPVDTSANNPICFVVTYVYLIIWLRVIHQYGIFVLFCARVDDLLGYGHSYCSFFALIPQLIRVKKQSWSETTTHD